MQGVCQPTEQVVRESAESHYFEQRPYGVTVTGTAEPVPNQAAPSWTRSMTSALAPVGGGASVIETTSWSPGRSTRGSATRGPSHNRTVPFAPSQCDDTETGRAPSGDNSTELALRIVTATGAGAERDTELMLNPTDARRSAITVSGRSSVATPCAENHDTPSRTRSTRSTYDPAVVGASTITAVCVDAPGAISAARSARAPSQRTMPPS